MHRAAGNTATAVWLRGPMDSHRAVFTEAAASLVWGRRRALCGARSGTRGLHDFPPQNKTVSWSNSAISMSGLNSFYSSLLQKHSSVWFRHRVLSSWSSPWWRLAVCRVNLILSVWYHGLSGRFPLAERRRCLKCTFQGEQWPTTRLWTNAAARRGQRSLGVWQHDDLIRVTLRGHVDLETNTAREHSGITDHGSGITARGSWRSFLGLKEI